MTEDTLLPFDLPAVKRKKEASGFKARTIHRLREVDPRIGGSRQDGEKPLDCGLLAVDETSMVDVLLKGTSKNSPFSGVVDLESGCRFVDSGRRG